MMNKYLEKIAEEEKKHKAAKLVSAIGASMIGGASAGTVFGFANHPVRNIVKNKIESVSDSGSDLHTVRKFMKDNNLHKTTTFNTRTHNIDKNGVGKGFMGKIYESSVRAHSGGPAFAPTRTTGAKKDFIIGARKHGKPIKNSDILMHELGHAKDFQSFGKLKALSSFIKNPVTAATATVAALSNDKTRDYAPAVAAVPGLLILREEGAANYHAYNGIKAHKGASAANKFLKRTVPSQMGAYALSVAAPVAGAYIAKKLMDKWHPKKK